MGLIRCTFARHFVVLGEARMHLPLAQFRAPDACKHIRSLAGFITPMLGFNYRYTQDE
jgi:hypothetical protein